MTPTKEQIVERLARADGWTIGGCPKVAVKGLQALWMHELPNYDSHDQLQVIIDGLDKDKLERYDQWLVDDLSINETNYPIIHRASVEQKQLALYRTLEGGV